MNNRQIAKKNMYNKLLVFFATATNAAIWAAFTRLVDEIARFVDKNVELDKFIQQQNLQTKGITTDKDTKFLALVGLVVKYARKARVWAHDNNNSDLETQFDIHKDDYTSIAQNLALEKLANVRKALNDNIGSLAGVNVTAASILLIDAAFTAYQNAEGTPGAAESKKVVGTEGVEAMMTSADKCLEIIDDLLINEYFETEREMVEEYKINHKIDTVGTHHQGMDAHITYDDGSGDAQGITMKIDELKKQGTSNILGLVEPLRGKIGTYHVIFSGTNIETKTIIASVKRSEILHLAVQVKKK